MRLHHVQVACPVGGEDAARRFYVEGLGLVEATKPEALRARGGCWFRAVDGDAVTAELHLGVEDPFAPALKAHPALVVDTVADLEVIGARLDGLGFDVDWTQRHNLSGFQRFHTFDAHGNRVELLTVES
ncbi:MAG TPA: VOC family protein [Propionibacteriaceae bacterium]